MKTLHPFNHRTAISLSIVSGVLLTALMLLGNLYNREQGIVTYDFHFFLRLFINLILFYVLFVFCFIIMQKKWPLRRRYVVTIVGTLLIAALYTLLSKIFRGWMSDEVIINKTININIIKDGVIAITVLLTTFLLFSLTRRQQIVLENQQLASENMRIRYEALESQLDPHFLFNSLNTLNGLIGLDDDKAHEYVQQLAATYRYIIQNNKLVRLQDELIFAESYIYLMQIRYGRNLIVLNNINPQYNDYYIVPISLQLLIENAIKHNVISDKYPLSVTMETTRENLLIVSNPIHTKEEEPRGEGLGLVNLTERYKLLFQKEVVIRQTNNVFRVELPLIKADDARKLVLNLK